MKSLGYHAHCSVDTVCMMRSGMKVKINKSEQVVLDVIRGKRKWRELYSFRGGFNRKQRYENAIASLKKNNLIYMGKDSILREVKHE